MALDLSHAGLSKIKSVRRNWTVGALVESAVCNREGVLSDHGALVVNTGRYTGRSPNDKFTVRDSTTENTVWWGKVNQPISSDGARHIWQRIARHFEGKDLFVQDCYAGASPVDRIRVRVVTERAWHGLFAHNMFISVPQNELGHFEPDFSVLHAPGLKLDPQTDKTNSEAAIVIDFAKRMVLICGTEYGGEIKKSIFTVLNYLLPEKGVLGMHCSANMADNNETALFFGLSGTGKTTLSADPKRHLIGDDEHGWNDHGIFNFEGGCYAKVIRLSPKDEPQIFATTQRFGTILENVVMDERSRKLDLNDQQYTENTRASYDLSQISNARLDGLGGHPKHIVMLTCDAFGVLPPISKMNSAQAMYHFLSGYTARVAGTERGVTEPTAVFSACFGAPFMPRHPAVYAKILGERIHKHQAQCWLVNTGWTGGPHGVGRRMPISWTRSLLDAALSGSLDKNVFKAHPIFKVAVPTKVEGVPADAIDPKLSWKNPEEYEAKARQVAKLFRDNFAAYRDQVSAEIIAAEPEC